MAVFVFYRNRVLLCDGAGALFLEVAFTEHVVFLLSDGGDSISIRAFYVVYRRTIIVTVVVRTIFTAKNERS